MLTRRLEFAEAFDVFLQIRSELCLQGLVSTAAASKVLPSPCPILELCCGSADRTR
jgi:hypothetical protein